MKSIYHSVVDGFQLQLQIVFLIAEDGYVDAFVPFERALQKAFSFHAQYHVILKVLRTVPFCLPALWFAFSSSSSALVLRLSGIL